MRLKNLTLLAIIAVSYQFILRTIGTFLPHIFEISFVAQMTIILSFLANVAILLFFVFFKRDYAKIEDIGLRKASSFAITGIALLLIINIQSFVLLISKYQGDTAILSLLYRYRLITAILPWLGSIFLFIFFYIFHSEAVLHKKTRLIRPSLLALIASLLIALVRTLTLSNYLNKAPALNYSISGLIFLLPIVLFNFIAMLWFFSAFYGEQKIS